MEYDHLAGQSVHRERPGIHPFTRVDQFRSLEGRKAERFQVKIPAECLLPHRSLGWRQNAGDFPQFVLLKLGVFLFQRLPWLAVANTLFEFSGYGKCFCDQRLQPLFLLRLIVHQR